MIYFSYGMTKSGSTLAFELTRALLEHHGHPQPRLSKAALGNAKRINYVDDVTPERAALITSEVAALSRPIVIKTHARPTPDALQIAATGGAHACLRDPRDMALSLLDAGTRAHARGETAFSEIRCLADAVAAINSQTRSLEAWLALPHARKLDYHNIAFAPKDVLAGICDDLGLPRVWPATLPARVARTRFTQLNQGQPHRHLTQMTAHQARQIARDCAPLMAHLDPNMTRPEPARVLPFRRLAQMARAATRLNTRKETP